MKSFQLRLNIFQLVSSVLLGLKNLCLLVSHKRFDNSKIPFELSHLLILVVLELLYEALPLFLSIGTRTHLRLLPDHDEPREKLLQLIPCILEDHHLLKFFDHVDLHLVGLCLHDLHARFIAFIDDCYDEIHEDYVSDKHDKDPDEPR